MIRVAQADSDRLGVVEAAGWVDLAKVRQAEEAAAESAHRAVWGYPAAAESAHRATQFLAVRYSS